MKPSDALRLHRNGIRRVVALHGARNPPVFGSVIHGDASEGSDLDFLVDPIDGKTTLASLVRIKREVELLTGIATDVLTPMALHERFCQQVLAEGVPVWATGHVAFLSDGKISAKPWRTHAMTWAAG